MQPERSRPSDRPQHLPNAIKSAETELFRKEVLLLLQFITQGG